MNSDDVRRIAGPGTGAGTPPADTTRSLFDLWGIGDLTWLWGTRIRILFVIDGRITESTDPWEFGLGYVLETLRDPSLSWWVRFEVTVENRDAGFRFTQEGFDIDAHDQIWFFGDWPGLIANDPDVGDDVIGDYDPLDRHELLALAEWMDRGGGVFAAGDHSLLGASMCHRIPRVRTMRRWTRAQGVPTFDGDARNETLVHGAGDADDWEKDGSPQQIYPVLHYDGRWPIRFGASPHPLLCGRSGVIEHFPDHMHEGGVFENDQVRLDEPLNIPDFDEAEYPRARPVVVAAAIAGSPGETFGFRPVPQVVAYGLTTHLAAPRRFPLISAYDGDSARVGRVVVESTWHHWFSMNLHGLRQLSPAYYAGMQDYYRNVGLWLATPAQRASMLFAATWGVLVGSQPGAFDAALGIRRLGERVIEVMGQTLPRCTLDEFVTTVAMPATPRRANDSDDRSWVWAPPRATFNTLVVGGLAIRMLEQAHHHINERAHGRESRFDAQAVRGLGLEGLETGRHELLEVLAEGSDRLREMREFVAEPYDQATLAEVPIDRAD
jgi:hypothetical protein